MIALSIVLLHTGGQVLLHLTPKSLKHIPVTIIQSNTSIEQDKKRLISIDKIKEYFLKEIKEAPSGLIILPEAAIPDFVRLYDPKYYKELELIANKQDKTLVIGFLDIAYDNNKLVPSNSVIILDKTIKDIKTDNIYNKQYIVPFGEYIPFRNYLPDYLKKMLNSLIGVDYYRGNTTDVISTSKGRIAPSICYEIIFPSITRTQIDNKADILVNMSNLAWFHDSIIKNQFIAFYIMRAAEAGKPLVASVNTGYSVIIDTNGRIIKKIPANRELSSTTNLRLN